MKFDFYVHGLWILSAVFFTIGSMIAGNIEWVEGTTPVSFTLALALAFAMYLVATMLMISASINARHEEK
jgi:hypothetical protein